jgi:RHS repeat-associated protein
VDRRLFVDVNGQTQPFARIDSSNYVSWYLTDHLGSVRLITDNSAAVIDQIDYDAWGNITNETNATNGDRYKYASGQYDAILGMTLYAHNSTGRWYMASNGNWLNADPTGLAAGPNPYDYVGNNPTNAIDPSGLAEKPDSEKIFGNQYGKWMFKQNNIVTLFGPYGSDVEITFIPNKKNVHSTEIAFVQIGRITDIETGKPAGISGPDETEKYRTTSDGWSIDRAPSKYGWFGYGDNGNPKPAEQSEIANKAIVLTTPGNSNEGGVKAALLHDVPGDPNQTPHVGIRFEFQTYAIAKGGKDAGKIYGGIAWGFERSKKGNNILSLHPRFISNPTRDFPLAVMAWDEQSQLPDNKQRSVPDQTPFGDAIAFDPLPNRINRMQGLDWRFREISDDTVQL